MTVAANLIASPQVSTLTELREYILRVTNAVKMVEAEMKQARNVVDSAQGGARELLEDLPNQIRLALLFRGWSAGEAEALGKRFAAALLALSESAGVASAKLAVAVAAADDMAAAVANLRAIAVRVSEKPDSPTTRFDPTK